MSLYQELSRVYDELFSVKSEKLNWIINKLELTENSNILDLGCGTGQLVISLGEFGYFTYGIDNDRHMIDRAIHKLQGKNNDRIHVAVGDLLRQYPFDTDYQGILCIGNTLPHLNTDSEVLDSLKLARDNLDENGKLLIQTVNFDQDNIKYKNFPLLTAQEGTVKFYRKYKPHEENNNKVKFITELEFVVSEEKYYEEVELLILTESKMRGLLTEAGFKNITSYCNFTDEKWHENCNSTVILAAV